MSDKIKLDEKALEAAAIAAFNDEWPLMPWENVSEGKKTLWRKAARAAITATAQQSAKAESIIFHKCEKCGYSNPFGYPAKHDCPISAKADLGVSLEPTETQIIRALDAYYGDGAANRCGRQTQDDMRRAIKAANTAALGALPTEQDGSK